MSKFKIEDRVEIVGGNINADRFVGTSFTIDSDEGEWDGEQCWSGRDSKSPYRYKESDLCLVGASPIRTVTRREIVPGVYRDVQIHEYFGNSVGVEYDGDGTVESLREAARIFNEIAEVLEENAASGKAAE